VETYPDRALDALEDVGADGEASHLVGMGCVVAAWLGRLNLQHLAPLTTHYESVLFLKHNTPQLCYQEMSTVINLALVNWCVAENLAEKL